MTQFRDYRLIKAFKALNNFEEIIKSHPFLYIEMEEFPDRIEMIDKTNKGDVILVYLNIMSRLNLENSAEGIFYSEERNPYKIINQRILKYIESGNFTVEEITRII